MKTIIAGSRSITDKQKVFAIIDEYHIRKPITQVVSGCARGIDVMGEHWALLHNVSVEYFPADWDVYGNAAGFERNERMGEYADALLAIWDGKSRGTEHMITCMKKLQKPFEVVVLVPEPAKITKPLPRFVPGWQRVEREP